MTQIFTEYVRRLTTGDEPLDQASYDEVREHLRALLVSELRKRGLWTAPPTYLGVSAQSWLDSGALEELVEGAYDYNFIDRLRGLSEQLKVKDNIEGLVRRNVRHFLTDRQRQADPLGYRVFVRLRAAIARLVELGRLFIRGLARHDDGKLGDGKPVEPAIRNPTTLAFSRRIARVCEPRVLDEAAPRWNDELMPELVTAEGRAVPKLVERLSDSVMTLPEAGVEAFRFGDLAKSLKDDARRRWQALWEALQSTAPEDGGEESNVVPITRPDETPDWPRFRDAVLRCVEKAIAAIGQAKRQRDLWTVWLFLRSSRVDNPEPRELPSYSELGRELSLPRERVPQMLDELKKFVCRCFGTEHHDPAENSEPNQEDPAEPVAMNGARPRR